MQNLPKTKIKEIFTSIQGEGLWVGERHIFVRFCKCNLNCAFCDTDFDINNSKEFSSEELYKILKDNGCEVVSLTGGEPLLDVEFLKHFLKNYKEKLNKKIYLETNGTLPKNLEKIIDYVDIVAMDIKLESATQQKNNFPENDNFLDIASKKDVFIKVVFDKNIKENEIQEVIKLAKKYNKTVVLQPKMPLDKDIDLYKIFNDFYKHYKNIRLICQTHKFLNLQ